MSPRLPQYACCRNTARVREVNGKRARGAGGGSWAGCGVRAWYGDARCVVRREGPGGAYLGYTHGRAAATQAHELRGVAGRG